MTIHEKLDSIIQNVTVGTKIKRINLGAFNVSNTYDVKSIYSDYKSLTLENFAVVCTASGCWHDNSNESGSTDYYTYHYDNGNGIFSTTTSRSGNSHAHQSAEGTVYLYIIDPES